MPKMLLVRCIFIVISFYAFGKIDFGFITKNEPLQYETHDYLYKRYKANQSAYTWTHGLTRKSPLVTINSDYLRGVDIDISMLGTTKILALGSSKAFGSGLHDREVWSSILNKEFQSKAVKMLVMNASNPGWGPYYWDTFIRMESSYYNPDVFLILLSYGDLGMDRLTSEENRAEWVKKDRLRKKFLYLDTFVAFCLRKADILFASQAKWFKKLFSFSTGNNEKKVVTRSLGSGGNRFHFAWGKNEPYFHSLMAEAKKLKKPLFLVIRNVEESKSGFMLFQLLKDLSVEYETTKVYSITSEDVQKPVELNARKYFEDYLVIKGDDHPNARYNTYMAEKLKKILLEDLDVNL